MKKWIFSLGLLLLLFTVTDEVFSQLPENKMTWQEHPLTWNDFKGTPETGNPFDANTNSGISYSWSLKLSVKETDFLYSVETYFYPDLSWVIPDKKSNDLLAHEQLHFDITELHARKLRKAMRNYKLPEQEKIKEELKKIYRDIEYSRTQMQERYDLETDHSQNVQAQQKWKNFIKSELEKLKVFEN